VPGRDEEWKRQTISNTSELQFQQEFGNTFHGSGNTLINADTLLGLKAQHPIMEQNNVKVYTRADPDHNYLMFVDVAKGRGQDYSTFNIIDITSRPFKQVCVFRDNMISPLLFPDVIYKWANHYNKAYVVVENNDQGSVVCNGLYYDLEYEEMFMESLVKSGGIGVMMNKKIKRIGCSNIKDLVEQHKIEIVDVDTIVEMSTFVVKGNSYEAADNSHDDLMMNFVLFGWYASTEMFINETDINVREMLFAEKMRAIEDEILPFGIHHDAAIEDPLANSEMIGGDRWYTYTGEKDDIKL
jgi:hypothetical protein